MPSDEKASIHAAIRQAILDGEYAPRQRLIESDLCERFGAGRFAVRSALQDLASQGLVEFEPNRGARVREISIAEAIEITEVRRVLEALLAARAAERVTRVDIANLRRIAKDMRKAVEQNELLHYGELNLKLHATIRQIAEHGTSARLLGQLRDLTVRHQFSLSLVPGRPSVSLPQHEAIIEAVTARDPKRAEVAMQAHLDSVLVAYQALGVVAQQR
jgi:DNA-binding GntR family transcriptional regulator